ncbi:MAG: porin family protein [Elusimicrobia bacterium]|nr:porin family protein [Candidatus Liberimonas magnetica]
MNGLKLKMSVITAALFLILPAMVSAETAQVGMKQLSIGPRATYSIPKDADQGQWYAGAQVRLHVSPTMGLEGSIDYRRNDYGRFTTIRTYPVQASLLAYLLSGMNWSPYLLGGGGWYYTQVDGAAGFSHDTSRFGTHLGFGFELMVNEGLSLDGSYRYIWLESVTSKDANLIDKTYQDSGSMITIALNFLF